MLSRQDATLHIAMLHSAHVHGIAGHYGHRIDTLWMRPIRDGLLVVDRNGLGLLLVRQHVAIAADRG